MNGSRVFAALVLALALLAAPAAQACGAAIMMWMDCCASKEAVSTPDAPCHAGLDTGKDESSCCAAASTFGAVPAVSFHNEIPQAGLQLSIEQPAPEPIVASAVPVPIDAWRLHELGRYTLFSAFLL